MPGYKGHIAGAVVCSLGYVGAVQTWRPETISNAAPVLAEPQLLTGLFVIAILFGLFPDIDTNSKGQNIFFGLAFAADIALILAGRIEAAALLGLVAMTPILGKHRGWTHSKWAMVLIPLPVMILAYLYRPELLQLALLIYGAAVTGYFSHLLLDGKIFRWFVIRGSRTRY